MSRTSGLGWTQLGVRQCRFHRLASLFLAMATLGTATAEDRIQFNRDVRPILSEHCWRCHGFDAQARQAGLRLDDRASALLSADSGTAAIVPGKPEQSALMERITSTDAATQMPPPESPRRLQEREVQILRQWIAEGAEYQQHWAFESIQSPPLPTVLDARNPIDAFVEVKLHERGLSFAHEADRATLLRRISFDLTGLPPALDDLDHLPTETFEQAVDRLLSSPHFGERMAVEWLDAARFADTDGYFGDKPRQMWLWREGVIDAFNRNQPFDQFTLEQLAGDLLPNATMSQRIATGFNRNHMSNDETGLIDEEFRVEYVVDRIDTTMSTWLGLTVGCAQCHDHKYDPISQREYYQLFAFFNNVPETGLLVGNNPPPRISVPTAEQERVLAERTTAVAEAVRRFEPLKAAVAADLAAREADFLERLPRLPTEGLVDHTSLETPLDERWRLVGTAAQSVPGIRGQAMKFDATQHVEGTLDEFSFDRPWTIGFWMLPEGSLSCPLSCIEPVGDRRGVEILWQKGRFTVNLVHQWGTSALEVVTHEPVAAKQWHHVAVTYDGSQRASGLHIFLDGIAVAVDVRRDALDGSLVTNQPVRIGRRDDGLGYYGQLDEVRILSRALTPEAITNWRRSDRIRGLLEIATDKRTMTDKDVLLDEIIEFQGDPPLLAARDAVRHARTAEQQLRASIPVALVMDELPSRRPTHVLERGQYNKPGEAVEPGVPTALSSWPADAPRNRLGFAQWLISPEHPLTARVAVNRLWRQCFGEGLVRTTNDFGTQGEPPTHPELLDYLATTFRNSSWDTKALLRLIVTSRTYRQQSAMVVRDGEIVDPENRWLSRGPSFRLPMEMIRDQALTTSGLLVPRLGGPSVKPYQPPGLWEDVSYNAEESYVPDRDEGLWRRSLYTYVKRQAPPPALLLFDGPTREKCTLRRSRTNTPLQALMLLNDETYVEAARHLAQQACASFMRDDERLSHLVRGVLSRRPRPEEQTLLMSLLERQRRRFDGQPDAARRLLAIGATDADTHVEPKELAAWTVLVQTIFNLDEAVMRR